MILGLLIKIGDGVKGCPKGNTLALRLFTEWLAAREVTGERSSSLVSDPLVVADDFNTCTLLIETEQASAPEWIKSLWSRIEIADHAVIVTIETDGSYVATARGSLITDFDFALFLERLPDLKRANAINKAVLKALKEGRQS